MSSIHYIALLLATCLVSMAMAEEEDYRPEEGLTGHNGVFQALPWTEFELSLISSLHATANYPEVMRMVKEKLMLSEVKPNDRRKIERMLKSLRPPPVFNNFLNEEETAKVQKAHGERKVEGVLSVIGTKLRELPEFFQEQAIRYLQKHTPTMSPP